MKFNPEPVHFPKDPGGAVLNQTIMLPVRAASTDQSPKGIP